MASNTKQKTDDILDWTIHDNLDPDDPLPPLDLPSGEAPGRRRPNRRQWIWLGAAALLVALAPWVYSQWGWQQTRQEIERLVAAETAAPPLPLSLVRPAQAGAPQLQALTQISVDTVRADVSHIFMLPDGQTVKFAMPHFYKHIGDLWSPSDAPPDSFPGEAKIYTGARVKISYYAADAALIEGTLAPYLEDLLGRACAEWDCADTAQATFDFVNAPRERRGRTARESLEAAADEPLVVALLAAGDLSPTDLQERAPHRLGYPVDPGGIDVWKRVLATKALAQLANAVVDPGAPDQLAQSPYFFALVARASERLGVERRGATQVSAGETARDMLQQSEWLDGPPANLSVSEGTRGALTILDALLRDQPHELELGLLHGLKQTPAGPLNWLTQAFRAGGMTAQEFYARLRSVLGRPEPASLPPLDEIDLALSCMPSPQLYSNGRLEPLPPLDGLPLPGFNVDWSPDGQRLVINTYLQAITLDLETGELFWPQVTGPDTNYAFPSMWVSDSILAYNQFPASLLQGGQSGLDKLLLSFVDVRDPASTRDGPTGVIAYPDFASLSPDRATLAVVQARPDTQSPGQAGTLALMPATGGPLTPVATDAFLPAWSPDGRSLAFAHLDAVNGGLSLHVWDPGTHVFTRLWNSQDSKLKLDRSFAGVQLAWSPDGAWIAVAMAGSGSDQGWLALFRVEGDVMRVMAASTRESPRQMSFSHDGRWLAAIFQTQQSGDLLIYDVTSGREVRRVEGGSWSNPAWSPRDDRLLVFDGEKAYLLSAPDAEPERLGDLSCMSGEWRP